MKNREGFTLAEMLITMALAVVLAAVVVPATLKPLEASRNKERETRISSAIYDAYTDACLQSSDPYSKRLPDAVLGDIAAHLKSGSFSVSFGSKKFNLTSFNVPTNAASVKCKFQKIDGVFQLNSLIFYDNSDAPIGDPIPALNA